MKTNLVQEKSKTISRSVAHAQQGRSQHAQSPVSPVQDNRPTAIAQRKLQESIMSGDTKQLLKVGKTDVNSLDDLVQMLGIDVGEIHRRFRGVIGNDFPASTVQISGFLAGLTKKWSGPKSLEDEQVNKFIGKLANEYKETYMERADSGFLANLKNIEKNEKYKTIMKPDGINYGAGEDDGAEISEEYNSNLACSLFAIRHLLPGFLGAGNEKELHYVLMSQKLTKGYDDDKAVAQIRISAGLKYSLPPKSGTVRDFIDEVAKKQGNGKKYIIDPTGEAHTFTLAYKENEWKYFDNAATGGKNPDLGTQIRVYWYL